MVCSDRLPDGNDKLVGVVLGKMQVSNVTKPLTDKDVLKLGSVTSGGL